VPNIATILLRIRTLSVH